MVKEKEALLSRVVLLADVIIIGILFPLSHFLQKEICFIFPFLSRTFGIRRYLVLFFSSEIVWIFFISFFQLHHYFVKFFKFRKIVRELSKVFLISLFIVPALIYFFQAKINRSLFLIYSFLIFISLLIFKYIFLKYFIHLNEVGRTCSNILLVGEIPKIEKYVEKILKDPSKSMKVIGILSKSKGDLGRKVINGVRVIGYVNDFYEVIHKNPVDEVHFFIPLKEINHFKEYLELCEDMGITVRISTRVYETRSSEAYVEEIFDEVFFCFKMPTKDAKRLFVKYTLDFIISLIALILLSPIFLLIAILIKLSSKGPVFFRQDRGGLNGRIFKIYKFRTMYDGADNLRKKLKDKNEMSGPVFKITNDPRVTKIGKILRKTSLDELPQLINVLKGEMSLVGPRPLLVEEIAGIKGDLRRRLSMKPGITCTWQISGRNEIDFEDWMKMDLEYVDNWSFRRDFIILLKTIPAVVSGKGAK